MEQATVTRADGRASDSAVGDESASSTFRVVRDPVWLVAFVLFSGLGLVWALSSPLFSVPDEPAHVVKAAALVRGDVLPPKLDVPDEGEGIVRGGFTTVVTVPESYTWNTSALLECHMFDPTVPAGCAPPFVDDPTPVEWTTWVGRYQPAFYGLVGWTTLLDTGTFGIYAMRALHVLVCAALLATALALTREAARYRLAALGIALAATPQVFFLAGGVNPNGLEAAAAICLWTALGVLALDERDPVPGHLLWIVGISGTVLAWSRPLSAVWLAVIVGVVACFVVPRARFTSLLRDTRARATAAIVGLISLGSLAWTLSADALSNNRGDFPRGLGVVDAFRHSLGRTGEYLEEMVGVFGWRTTRMPDPAYWAWGALVVVVVVLALRFAPRRLGVGVLVTAAGAALAPSVLQAPEAAEIGFPWQGRYGLALAVGVPLLATLAVGVSRRLGPRGTTRLSLVVVTVVAAVQVLAHAVSMRRYVVGSDGPIFYLDQPGWDPPLPSWLLLVATVVLAGALAVLVHRVVVADAPVPWRRRARPGGTAPTLEGTGRA